MKVKPTRDFRRRRRWGF